MNIILIFLLAPFAHAFVIPNKRTSNFRIGPSPTIPTSPFVNPNPTHQISSSTQLMGGLFGLGVGEIVIILIGIGVVLGPDKIKDLIRSSAGTAGEFREELSKVPEEFQKGLEEGKIESRARKAKKMAVDAQVESVKDPASATGGEDNR